MATANNGNGKKYANGSSLNSAIKSVCDILRRSNCASATQYIPELTWLLFLRILDQQEDTDYDLARAVGSSFKYALKPPYRWRDWAKKGGKKRTELEQGFSGDVFKFVNNELLPYLKSLRSIPGASQKQKMVSAVMENIEKTKIDTEKNFLDVLDKINEIGNDSVDDTHMFPLSQAYEGLLLKMGEKNNDGGQFFTPRQIIKAIVKVVDPKVGDTVYDPCCGTGGFLAESFKHMSDQQNLTPTRLEQLKQSTFYGREKENLIFPIALANLVLHGIDKANLWHGNTLTDQVTNDDLFKSSPDLFDVVLTNPPFGGKEGKEAQAKFDFKTSATQVLFLQHVINSLKQGGRCGMVIDEGVLFRTNENAFLQTKRKLLDECNLYCIVSLPPGVFVCAGAGVKTNLLFFVKGESTEKIWYYDLSGVKVGKKKPFMLEQFEEFFKLLPTRGDSEHSWTVKRDIIESKNYDLKAVNPNAKVEQDSRTPGEILDLIEEKSKEIKDVLAKLRET